MRSCSEYPIPAMLSVWGYGSLAMPWVATRRRWYESAATMAPSWNAAATTSAGRSMSRRGSRRSPAVAKSWSRVTRQRSHLILRECSTSLVGDKSYEMSPSQSRSSRPFAWMRTPIISLSTRFARWRSIQSTRLVGCSWTRRRTASVRSRAQVPLHSTRSLRAIAADRIPSAIGMVTARKEEGPAEAEPFLSNRCQLALLRGARAVVVERRGHIGLVREAERDPGCGHRLLGCEVVERSAGDRVQAGPRLDPETA